MNGAAIYKDNIKITFLYKDLQECRPDRTKVKFFHRIEHTCLE